MSYRSRIYRQRNVQQSEHDQSKDQDKFFGKSSQESGNKGTKNAFFQAKSDDTSGAEDSLEKEANNSAAAMASQDAEKGKEEETIQKLATPEEDKQTSTNDERQKDDTERQA